MTGRPRLYETVEDLEKACDEFFDKATKPTVTGLALSLGFADKSSIYEYRDRPEFSYPIKRALTMIENYHEQRLSENNVTGAIFALKNMGWKDKTEVENSGTSTVVWKEEKTYEAEQKANEGS